MDEQQRCRFRCQRCHRLVLVPFPSQGHITPMLQLATLLHSNGFSITIAYSSLLQNLNAFEYPNFGFLPIQDGLSNNELPTKDFLARISIINEKSEAPFRESLARMIENGEMGDADKVSCVVYDEFMKFCEVVASSWKLPSMMCWSNSVMTLLSLNKFPRLQKDGYIPFRESMAQELVPGLHSIRFNDLSYFTTGGVDAISQFIAETCNIGSSTGIIWNTVDCLEKSNLAQLRHHYQVPFFCIGPLHKISQAPSCSLMKEDNNCIQWLDKQRLNSVIYISLGSIASIDEKELAEIAWGLADSKQPFLWVIRPGLIGPDSEGIEQLPAGFKETVGENACIVKWAPQQKVLAHPAVGGFWSHCGWNSTLESICDAVPIICQPCFGDQRANARHLTQMWKVGLALGSNLERGEIERVVRKLMVGKEGEEMRKRSMELKKNVDLCMKQGGSSYNALNQLVDHIMSL